MKLTAIEARARRGTAEDLVVLARLFGCLDLAGRQALQAACCRVSPGHAPAARVVPEHPDWPSVEQDLPFAIHLLESYCALNLEGKADLFGAAIELLAAARLRAASADSNDWEHLDDWLRELAQDTYPSGDEVDRLLSFAKGVEPDWEECLFPDGPQNMVTSPSEFVVDLADGLLVGYETIRGNAPAFYCPPPAEDFLGIEVLKGDFREWDGDGWILDESRWRDAVRDATVARFAELVAGWRANFFEALIAGDRPRETLIYSGPSGWHARSSAAKMPS